MDQTSDPLPAAIQLLCCLGCVLTIASAIAIAWIAIRSQRQHREAQAAAAWQGLQAAAQAAPEAHLCHVEQVYQRARRGSKAVIIWHATGQRQDTWFWYFLAEPGSTLLVSGATAYGPHNHNPYVLYVENGGVLASAPPGAEAAWYRLQATS